MCVCNFERREMKYELHFQFWTMFLTLCSVIDFVCVVTRVGHRTLVQRNKHTLLAEKYG